MAVSNQICQLDTATLARRIAAKELSPVEAVDAVLERLDRLDDALVLRASAAYEAAAPWRDHWPPILAELGL